MSKVSSATKREIEDKKMQFGMWLGLPPKERQPRTQNELAAHLGVDPPQLSKWAGDPTVLNAKKNAVELFFGKDIKFKIMETLSKRAVEEGHVPSGRLVLEVLGVVGKQPSKIDTTQHDFTIRIVAPKEEDGVTDKSTPETEGTNL